MYTIGFCGSNKREVAQLFTDFVVSTTETGIQKDQDHPPAIVCGIDKQTPEDEIKNFQLLKTLGAKIIVSADYLDETKVSEIKKLIGDDVEIMSLKDGENKESFFTKIREKSFEDKSNSHQKNGGFKHLGEKSSWSQSQQGKSLEILANYSKKAVGIIGGAGVMTGANFCLDLADKDQRYLMLSDSTAPDKNNAIMVGGENFAPQYLQDITMLSSLTPFVAIPCNTAHIKKEEFCGSFLEENGNRFARLVDIGDATLSKLKDLYPDSKKVIFLGTPATLSNPKSTYNTKKLSAYGIDAIKPNEEELDKIYRAIYKVKGFQSDEIIKAYRQGQDIAEIKFDKKSYEDLKKEAKELIMQVIKEMREEQLDSSIPVILGCTEFPVVFSYKEMADLGLISSSDALAEAAKTRVLLSRQSKRKRSSDDEGNSPNTSPRSSPSPLRSSSFQSDPDSDIEVKENFSIGEFYNRYSENLRVIQNDQKIKVYIDKLDNGKKLEAYQDMQRFYQLFGFNRQSDKIEKHFSPIHFSIPITSGDTRIEKLKNWLESKGVQIELLSQQKSH